MERGINQKTLPPRSHSRALQAARIHESSTRRLGHESLAQPFLLLTVQLQIGVHAALAGHPNPELVEAEHDRLKHQQRDDHSERYAPRRPRLVSVVEERPDVRVAFLVGPAARPVDHSEEVEDEVEGDRVDEVPEADGRGGDEELDEAEQHGERLDVDLGDGGLFGRHVGVGPEDDGDQDGHRHRGIEEEPLDLVAERGVCQQRETPRRKRKFYLDVLMIKEDNDNVIEILADGL